MSALTPGQDAAVRTIVAEMIGQALRGVNERIIDAAMASMLASDDSINGVAGAVVSALREQRHPAEGTRT